MTELDINDLERGFHNRDGWYFRREHDGAVRLWRVRYESRQPVLECGPHLIPENEWASIVASVSRDGESGASWQSIRDQHATTYEHRMATLASAVRKMLPPALLAEVIAHLDPVTPFVAALRRADPEAK